VRQVRSDDGETLAYDALLLAVGGVPTMPYPRALAFGGPGTDERMHGLIQDVEAGYVKRIAFVVAPGVSWPMPLYELALLTAERAYDTCADVELTLVTPERSPLALFGPGPSRDVTELLGAAGIALKTRAYAEMPACNVVELHPHGERLTVDRAVTLPVLVGPATDGLPHDEADGYSRSIAPANRARSTAPSSACPAWIEPANATSSRRNTGSTRRFASAKRPEACAR
jgi:sulfide:quinone oxidoreductase